MPDYEFRAPNGTVKTKFFPIAYAPELGSFIDIDGERCERIISFPVINANPISKRYPIASRFLKRNHPGCETTPDGRSIIKDAAHEKHLCETYGYAKDGED